MAFNNGTVPIGTILPYAGEADKVPPGWLLCDGSSYQISEYLKLFKVLNHNFSNKSNLDDSVISSITISSIDSLVEQEFAIPDCRGRYILGSGRGKEYPNSFNFFDDDTQNGDDLVEKFLGWYIGDAQKTLSANNLPPHDHELQGYGTRGSGGLIAIAFGLPITGNLTGITGEAEPFDINPASIVVNFIIRAV